MSLSVVRKSLIRKSIFGSLMTWPRSFRLGWTFCSPCKHSTVSLPKRQQITKTTENRIKFIQQRIFILNIYIYITNSVCLSNTSAKPFYASRSGDPFNHIMSMLVQVCQYIITYFNDQIKQIYIAIVWITRKVVV